MKILGISSDFHDSSAALVVDGDIVATAAEERFSLQKHDSCFPSLAIDACLRAGGISASELDLVAYHEDPVVKFSRVLSSRLENFPRGFGSFSKAIKDVTLGQLWAKFDIFRKTGIPTGRIHYVPHHLGHAAYAMATSQASDAAILVLDAVGEWSSTSWFTASRGDGGMTITPEGVVPYPHSLGMLYSAFTAFLGFKVNDGECSTMALASFGKPRLLDQVHKILRQLSDGSYELDLSYLDFSGERALPLSSKFFSLFGEPRSPSHKLAFQSTGDQRGLSSFPEKDLHYADVAASIQLALEECVLALCAKIARETKKSTLCLSGGVALNSTMNGRIMRESGFSTVYIPPDPGDGGGAAGAALYLGARFSSKPKAPFTPFLGLSYSEEETAAAATDQPFEQLSTHRVIPSDLGLLRKVSAERFSEFDDLAESVSSDLSAGKVVGWFQGRFESGPRALGNRSILVDPRNAVAAKRLSLRVKLRAAFRPYACSVLHGDRETFFKGPASDGAPGTRWMSSTHEVNEQGQAQIAQALHIDGTTRPQILTVDDNPRYFRLLEAWKAKSGVPAILNTSFNEAGYPMVASPLDAMLMFFRTDLETLVLNDTVLRKIFS